MEGIESCDDFFQLTQAITTHMALHTTASETDRYPIGRKKSNIAGLKMKATTRNATVVVYSVPVDFCPEANMATSSVVGWAKKRNQID
jgi:hypothetical protein